MPPISQTSKPVTQTSSPDAIVTSAAAKYGIPDAILDGVFGLETDRGQNSKTSSAGAIGWFQFMPATARAYNYPLTNTPSALQSQQQADAAAHYLSDLFKQYGNWDDALKHYSGGGYGITEVDKEAHTGSNIIGAAGNALSSAGDVLTAPLQGAESVVSGVSSASDAIGKFWTLVSDVQTWIRLGEAIAGLVLVYLGLKTLTGK